MKYNPTLEHYPIEKVNEDLIIRGDQIYKSANLRVANVSGGATIDTEARTAVNSLLAILRDISVIKR